MEIKKDFEQVMEQTVNMALATSVADSPNVRVVTFVYDAAYPKRVFFTSFKGNRKTKEFEKNAKVACMPLPENPDLLVQVRLFGAVQKSSLPVNDFVNLLDKKSPENAETIREGGDMLDVYEVCFADAFVTVGMSEPVSISL